MQSGGALGADKKDGETFLKGIGGRITYGTEGLFLPLTLGLPNATRKTQSRFTSELQRPYRKAGSCLLNSCLQYYTSLTDISLSSAARRLQIRSKTGLDLWERMRKLYSG